MTFAIRNLSVLNYAQGYTSWHYRGHETTMGATLTVPVRMGAELTVPVTIVEVLAEGFFNPSEDMITPGDTIMVSCADGGVLLYVDSVQGGVKVRVMAQTGGE